MVFSKIATHLFFPCLFAFFCFVIQGTVIAELPIKDEIDRVQTANENLKQVAKANLELEKYYLKQIRGLRENGHASWLELARQEVLVDSMTLQLQSLQEFIQFVDEVEERISKTSSEVSHKKATRVLRGPVKVYSPGSIRLIGWFEPTELIEPSSEKQGQALTSEKELAPLEKQFKQAEKNYQELKAGVSPLEHWTQQAKLKRNLALAKLNYAQFAHKSNRPQLNAKNKYSVQAKIENNDFISANNDNDLHVSTYKVAWAEANARSQLKLRELALYRNERRLRAIEKLHADGFATKSELNESCKLVENAQASVRQEQQRLLSLQAICQDLSVHRFTMLRQDEVFSERSEQTCQWPEHILNDAEWIRHLIDLRRRSFDLEGQQAVVACKLANRKKYLQKLQAAIQRTQSTHQQTANLRSSLRTGEQRQIDSLKLELKSLAIQIQDFDEQLAIIALEEDRFIKQAKQQDRAAELSFVGIKSPGNYQPNDYLETPELELYADLDFSIWGREDCLFSIGHRKKGSPLIANRYPIWQKSSLPNFDFLNDQHSEPSPRSISMSRLPVGSTSSYFRERYRFGTYSSHDIYPNGILRPDLRKHLPAGYVPWYLPGSPTNIQIR